MNSTDLFSHPDQPQVVQTTEASSEDVQDPVFSDLPQRDAPPAVNSSPPRTS